MIMGSDASKPVQPPENWERNGDHFRIISPMSDISNPSEINRVYHHQRRPEPKVVDPNRRASRTVTKAIASSNPHSDIPAPSSFYFPTKESQKFSMRTMSRRDDENAKENHNGLKKMIKKSKKVMAGCFVSEQEDEQDLVQLQAIDLKKVRTRPAGIRGGRTNQSFNNRSMRISDADGYEPDLVIKKQMSSIEEEESNNSSKNSNPVNDVAIGISEMALHQEDAYFDRLTGGFNAEAQASPCVLNTELRNIPATLVDSVADQEASGFDSSMNGVFKDLDTTSVPSKESRSGKSSTSRSNRSSLSSIVQVSSHIGLTTVAGQTAAKRMSAATAESMTSGSDEESSAMSYGVRRFKPATTQSAFRLPKEPLKQVATLGKQSRTSYGSQSRRSSQGTSVSKLESLFRPVLPAFSADDASAASFDPYEIKVTESAPSQLEGNHRRLEVHTEHDSEANQLAMISPSMLSLDSQTHQSPSMVKKLLSHQAVNNGEFLFTSDYGPVSKKLPHSNRDSAIFSISTLGARSRLSHRSAKAVPIPAKQSSSVASDDSSKSSSRQVRFSNDTKPKAVDIPLIESKMSDLTDLGDLGVFNGDVRSNFASQPFSEEVDTNSPDEGRVRWAYSVKDGSSTVTPYVKGKSMLNVTNSPYVRFHAAKDKWESQEIEDEDLAAQTKNLGSHRLSIESGRSLKSVGSIQKEASIESEENETPEASDEEFHWSYSNNGVTPHLSKGAFAENVAKSPMNRFNHAKTKFGSIKEVPAKSPRAVKTKRKGAGGVVTARIEALDRKVIENRRLKRKLKNAKKSNPRRFQVVNASYVRSRKLEGYTPKPVDLDKLNLMGAAKFNKLPNFDDDDMSSIHSSVFLEEANFDSIAVNDQYPHDEDEDREEDSQAESAKRLSTASSAVSTVLQEKRFNHHRVSESSYSTSASSGLSRVKKQVFENRYSLSSIGDSTTLSSIIGKENETYLPFRAAPNTVKPREQKLITLPESLKVSSAQETPLHARKWRSLAAAAQEKDSTKKAFADWKQRHGNKKFAGHAE